MQRQMCLDDIDKSRDGHAGQTSTPMCAQPRASSGAVLLLRPTNTHGYELDWLRNSSSYAGAVWQSA
eukprot:14540486-Alexandrium_andersonii.AAC.1